MENYGRKRCLALILKNTNELHVLHASLNKLKTTTKKYRAALPLPLMIELLSEQLMQSASGKHTQTHTHILNHVSGLIVKLFVKCRNFALPYS